MLQSGKTPLLRARSIEKICGVGEIYLKLEGANPSGHKMSRIAEALINDAEAHHYSSLLVDGTEAFIDSVLYFAAIKDLLVYVIQSEEELWKEKYKDHIVTLDFRFSGTYKEYLDLAQEYQSYLAVEGVNNRHISQMMLGELTDEITRKIGFEFDHLFMQFGYGYTMTSAYNSFLKGRLSNQTSHFPKLICGSRKRAGRPQDLSEQEYDSQVLSQIVYRDSTLLLEAQNALKETDGEISYLSEEQLTESSAFLLENEGIYSGKGGCYAFAAFYDKVKRAVLNQGRHVIIMNDGKSKVQIEQIESRKDLSKQELVAFTKKWLDKYSDSTIETEDAISSAIDNGFILVASHEGECQGVCVIVHTGFDNFLPTYHLGYIGTDKKSKGRGIGSELIKRAIDLTNGNLSLHVDLDNDNAKKLYEKMGFKHVYNRMIYQNNEEA